MPPHPAPPAFVACIPAAGAGRRMGADLPKQYLPLAGRPVIAWTLAVFDALPACTRIVIATDDAERLRAVMDAHPLATPVSIVPGGGERQDSVRACLAACDDDEIVLVHDAARPCVTAEEVSAVLMAVARHGAALLALPSRDTVKYARADARDIVETTLERTRVWLAQTPQGARAGQLRAALEEARRSGRVLTDDAAALESASVEVRMVEGSPDNLKITTPGDVLRAEAVLRRQGRLPHA